MKKILLMAIVMLINANLVTASYVLSTDDYNIYTTDALSVANESTSDYLLFTSPTQASWTYYNLTDYNYYGGHISIFQTIALGETNVSEEIITPTITVTGGGGGQSNIMRIDNTGCLVNESKILLPSGKTKCITCDGENVKKVVYPSGDSYCYLCSEGFVVDEKNLCVPKVVITQNVTGVFEKWGRNLLPKYPMIGFYTILVLAILLLYSFIISFFPVKRRKEQ